MSDLRRLGFERTACDCPRCQVYCRHVPGRLIPEDLEGLLPEDDAAALAWAETNLRAATDRNFPKLIPAANNDGACHWFVNGRCSIHQQAPFGCAVFDAHMAAEAVRERSQAASNACLDDASRNGRYTQVWRYLVNLGLLAAPPDRAAVDREMRQLEQSQRTENPN